MDPKELERRIVELQDVEAIKRLKAEYCEICDDAHDPDRIVEIFAPDCVWESDGIAVARGHVELRRLFEDFARRVSFSQHNVFNPRISVDGDRAHGSWYLLGPFTFRDGSRPMWIALRYEEDYMRIEGRWKIRHLRAIGRMATPFAEGSESVDDPGIFDRT